MCAYARVHTYAYKHKCTHVHTHTHACTHKHTQMYMHTCACTHMHVQTQMCTHTHKHTNGHRHKFAHHTNAHMHKHAHTHTHTHTHTHMNMHSLLPGPPTFLWCLLLPGMFARIARHFLQHSALSLPCSPSPSLPAQKRVLKFHPAHPRILVRCPHPVTAGTWRQAWC